MTRNEHEYYANINGIAKALDRIANALEKNDLQDKYANRAEEAMHKMVENLRQFQAVEIIGYGVSQIEKIANKYRYQILLRADKSTDLLQAIKASKVDLAEIDMDPIEFI